MTDNLPAVAGNKLPPIPDALESLMGLSALEWRAISLPSPSSLSALADACAAALEPAPEADIVFYLDRIGDVLPMPTEGAAYEVYIRALKAYPKAVIRLAAWDLIRTYSYPSIPKVADLVKRCEEQPAYRKWRRAKAVLEFAEWESKMRANEAEYATERRAREQAFWADLRAKYAHLPKKVSTLSQATVHDETPAEFAARKAQVLKECVDNGLAG